MSRFVSVNATGYGAPVFRDTQNPGPYYSWKVGPNDYWPFFPALATVEKLQQSEVTGEAIALENTEIAFRDLPDGWHYESPTGDSMQEVTAGGLYRFYPIVFSSQPVQQMENVQNVQSQTSQASSAQNSATQNSATQTGVETADPGPGEIAPINSSPSTGGGSPETGTLDNPADESQSDGNGGLILVALLLGGAVIASRNRRNRR